MRYPERLFVMWGDAQGRRHVIGELWREGALFAFGYDTAALPKVFEKGFQLLPEFPEPRSTVAPYTSPYLFATFEQRIPQPQRPDYKAILTTWGVPTDCDDQLTILAASGGIQLTDTLELAEHRDSDDELIEPLRFRVSGEKHSDGGQLVHVGDTLYLRRDPSNPQDPSATWVVEIGQRRVGFVPRQYSDLIANLLDAKVALSAKAVRRLGLPPERDRWIVEVRRVRG